MRRPRPADLANRMALATALGICIGLIPKDSLVAYSVALVAMLLPTHLVWLAISSAFFWALSGVFQPLFHKLGALLLTSRGLIPLWDACASLPVIPWTRFDNTVAIGAMASSLLLVSPGYYLALGAFRRILPKIAPLIDRNHRAVRSTGGSVVPAEFVS